MYTLKVSIDPGSSATKFAYQVNHNPIKCFSMTPFCSQVPLGYPDTRWPHEDSISHLESSWLTLSEHSVLFGLAAQKFYGSQVKNSERKFEKALYKVLAILSHIQLHEAIESPINLGILLPFDEYSTKVQLESAIRKACDGTQIHFCGYSQPIDIESISIRPEGAGLFLRGLPAKIDAYHSRIAILVMGHRNVSWLVMRQGVPSSTDSTTNNLGFRWVLQEIKARSGFKDELALAEMICSNREIPPDMEADIKSMLLVYWQELQGFLREQAPVDFVLCGGGAAWRLKPQLSAFFPKRLGWAQSLAKSVHQAGVKDQGLAQRMADCYGLLLSMGAVEHD